jgi:hypothetical protein
VIEFFGITIHDADVVFTDLGLALLGAWFAWRLWHQGNDWLSRSGSMVMAGLASAAFWGSLFHAFFPDDTSTTPGFVAWIPVALSILLAAATMLALALRLLAPRLWARLGRTIVAAYALAFTGTVLLVDESFGSIVRFYGPALLLFLAGAGVQAIRTGSRAWRLIAGGLLLSVVAALLQQAEVAFHPEYFDHNAVYHVVQSIALVILYLGFRRVPEAAAVFHATGSNPARRAG